MRDSSPVIRVVAQTRGVPTRALDSLRDAITRVDPRVPVWLDTMEGLLSTDLAKNRFLVTIIGILAALAAILAAAGVFAVMADSTAQRAHEIGVRLALGGQRGDIIWMILADALRLSAVGGGLSVLGALAMSRVLRSLMFEISAFNPVIVIGAVLLFVLVSIAASTVPALRAAATNAAPRLLAGN